jgi:hypothetical protein
MMVRMVLAAVVAAAGVTAARGQAPAQGATSGVGTIAIEPNVVPPLRSFRVQPQDAPAQAPALPAARPVEDDANMSPAAPRAQPGPERHEQASTTTYRRHGSSAELQAPAPGRRGKHARHSQADAPGRDVAKSIGDPVSAGARPGPSLNRAQRETIVAAILQDGKGVVPDASAPFPDYPVGAKVAQFSLMVSPLPAGAIARLPQLGA